MAEAARRHWGTLTRWSRWSAPTGVTRCAAMLPRDAGLQYACTTASDTTTPACMRYYHTHLPSIECPARPQLLGHQVGEADDEISRQRGVWDVPANYVKVAFRRDFPGANTATAAMRRRSATFVFSSSGSLPTMRL